MSIMRSPSCRDEKHTRCAGLGYPMGGNGPIVACPCVCHSGGPIPKPDVVGLSDEQWERITRG